ncbi:MAG: ribonuclease III [Firmicutes bacterium]|nr:ribonuclease III [Bacillota bacterium]
MSQQISYREFENLLGYSFNNQDLLIQAFTHKSYAKLTQTKDNERLEFLGDAVLQLVVSTHLYKTYPDLNEGLLAKVRALLVSQPTLARIARDLRIDEFLLVGRNEERNKAMQRDSLLCDALEAVYGAVYLDGGFEAAAQVILADLPEWDEKTLRFVDAKSSLQEYLQQRNHERPIYKLVEAVGPDHNKLFVIEVYSKERLLGRGSGRTKKEAAQQAARAALDGLEKDR